MGLCERLAAEYITHDGGNCPCVGEYVEVHYSDGKYLVGVGAEHIYWRYVTHYRLIARS